MIRSQKGRHLSFLIVLPLLSLHFSAFGKSHCAKNSKITLARTQAMTEKLIAKHPEFSDLKTKNFEYKLMGDDKETFFKTFFSIASKVSSLFSPRYIIYVNKNINRCSPKQKAFEAIMAHELFHIIDYVNMTNSELIQLAVNYGPEYERRTDQKAVKLGYGQGLIEFRKWVYALMPSEQALKKKQKFYLSPGEIIKLQNTK